MTGVTRENIFRLKRSNVPGKIPTTSQLLVGEMAVNTRDGFLYTSISDSGGTNVVGIRQIGWDRLSTISGGTVDGLTTFNAGLRLDTSFQYKVSPSNGYVLTSDAVGNASWQPPTGSSGSTTDYYVTGFTYNNANILTISQNGLPNLSVTISNMTGLTVNGTLSATTIQGDGSGIINVGLRTKSGQITAGTFAGTPRKANVTFTGNFPTTDYSISVLGGDNRTFTYESKTVSGFTINANSAAALTQPVLWMAIQHGEY